VLLHYETQETLKKQEEPQKKETVGERKKDPKNTEKCDGHKEKVRKQEKKQAFPFVIKKKEGKGDTKMKQERKKCG
jgi:hypothetical protein